MKTHAWILHCNSRRLKSLVMGLSSRINFSTLSSIDPSMNSYQILYRLSVLYVALFIHEIQLLETLSLLRYLSDTWVIWTCIYSMDWSFNSKFPLERRAHALGGQHIKPMIVSGLPDRNLSAEYGSPRRASLTNISRHPSCPSPWNI